MIAIRDKERTCCQARELGEPSMYGMLCPHRVYSSRQEKGACENCSGIKLTILDL
jgi:hypothetical protein